MKGKFIAIPQRCKLIILSIHEEGLRTPSTFDIPENRHRWKSTITKGIALMDAVIQNSADSELGVDKFDDAIAAMTHDDHYYELHEASGDRAAAALKPAEVAQRLRVLLTERLPSYSASCNKVVKESGRPSRLIRYWLPITVLAVGTKMYLASSVN